MYNYDQIPGSGGSGDKATTMDQPLFGETRRRVSGSLTEFHGTILCRSV